MSKCKQCDRDIAQPKDKYCGACVHNAYAELEAEVARLSAVSEILQAEVLRLLDEASEAGDD